MNGILLEITPENRAKIQVENGNILEFPSDLLPPDTKIGNKLYINIQTEATQKILQQDFNKNLLNQILQV